MRLLEVVGVSKWFGGLSAVNNCSLSVEKGEVHALIGPNGAGKTTLISLVSGLLFPEKGRILFQGRDVTHLPDWRRASLGIGRTFQIVNLFPSWTVLQNLVLAIMARDGHGFRFWKPVVSERHLFQRAEVLASFLGLEERLEVPVAALPHGERRTVEIAMALATSPRLLLLDEPLAGLSPQESVHVVQAIRKVAKETTVLLVEHDMEAVFQLAHRVTVMAYGTILLTGSPPEVQASKEVQQVYLGEHEPFA